MLLNDETAKDIIRSRACEETRCRLAHEFIQNFIAARQRRRAAA